MQRPDGSKRHTSTSNPLPPVMALGCCVAWCQGKQAEPQGHADLQQQPTAQRVAVLIAKAAQYTDEYEQVVSTGLLEQGVVPDLHLAWKAAFHAAVSAVYLSGQLRVHDAMCGALSETTHMLPRNKQKALAHAETATASSNSGLAQSQALATHKQPTVTEAASQQAQQPAHISTEKQPVRSVKAAWPEFSKHHKCNSVSPLALQGIGADCQPMADLPPESAAVTPQTLKAHQHSMAELPMSLVLESCVSVAEQLQWHEISVQQWPIELRSTYCLVILKTIRQILTAEQQGYISADTTVKQLCQAVGCATGLENIATNILQAGAAWEQDAVLSQMLHQQAQCRSREKEVVSMLSSSIVRLHLDAVNKVVLAGIDNNQWYSSRKPLTWPDAPGHAVRLWRQLLQSLKEALLSNCPAVVAQDVLGRALLEGVQSIDLRYSQLRPSEQWQPRLAADKWYIAETCQLMSQLSDSVYRSMELAVSSSSLKSLLAEIDGLLH
ncbi:TPA: hypothetical protein ACH3X1_011135 [Trebouxia sp. C0004]